MSPRAGHPTRLVATLLWAAFGPLPAVAEEYWVPQNLFGGEPYQVVFDSQDGERAFVAAPGGIFRTVDGASSWQVVQQGFGAGPLTTLAVAPSDPDHLYSVRGTPELYASTDGGEKWRLKYECAGCQGGFHQLAVDPGDPETVYACDLNRGVQVSLDGGATFTIEDGPACSQQLLAPAAGVVFAVSSNLGLSRSVDYGASWSSLNPISGFEATGVAVEPLNPERIYLSGRDGLGSPGFWVSSNGGATWSVGGAGLGLEGRVEVAPSEPSKIFLWNHSGLWVSNDSGSTFTPMSVFGSPVGLRSLAVSPTASDYLLVVTLRGDLLRTTSDGLSWSRAHEGIRSGSVRSLRVDVDHPGRILALQDRRLVRRNEDGDIWREGGIGISPRPVIAYWLDPRWTLRVYASSGDALWLSTLLGAFFDVVAHEPVTALVFDPSDPDVMLAARPGSGLIRSRDRGVNWGPWGNFPVEPLVFSLFYTPGSPQGVFAATGHGLYRSKDGGLSWTLLDLPQGVVRAEFHPQHPERLFALASGDLYVSADGGTSWTPLLIGRRLLDFSFAGPASPLIYVVGAGLVLRSTNLGLSWEEVPSNGLVEPGGQALAVDPRAPWQPYLGTFRHGLYQLESGGLFADGFETGDTSAWSLAVP